MYNLSKTALCFVCLAGLIFAQNKPSDTYFSGLSLNDGEYALLLSPIYIPVYNILGEKISDLYPVFLMYNVKTTVDAPRDAEGRYYYAGLYSYAGGALWRNSSYNHLRFYSSVTAAKFTVRFGNIAFLYDTYSLMQYRIPGISCDISSKLFNFRGIYSTRFLDSRDNSDYVSAYRDKPDKNCFNLYGGILTLDIPAFAGKKIPKPVKTILFNSLDLTLLGINRHRDNGKLGDDFFEGQITPAEWNANDILVSSETIRGYKIFHSSEIMKTFKLYHQFNSYDYIRKNSRIIADGSAVTSTKAEYKLPVINDNMRMYKARVFFKDKLYGQYIGYNIGKNYNPSNYIVDDDDADGLLDDNNDDDPYLPIIYDDTGYDQPNFAVAPQSRNVNKNAVPDYDENLLTFQVDKYFADLIDRDRNWNGVSDEYENDWNPDYEFDYDRMGHRSRIGVMNIALIKSPRDLAIGIDRAALTYNHVDTVSNPSNYMRNAGLFISLDFFNRKLLNLQYTYDQVSDRIEDEYYAIDKKTYKASRTADPLDYWFSHVHAGMATIKPSFARKPAKVNTELRYFTEYNMMRLTNDYYMKDNLSARATFEFSLKELNTRQKILAMFSIMPMVKVAAANRYLSTRDGGVSENAANRVQSELDIIGALVSTVTFSREVKLIYAIQGWNKKDRLDSDLTYFKTSHLLELAINAKTANSGTYYNNRNTAILAGIEYEEKKYQTGNDPVDKSIKTYARIYY